MQSFVSWADAVDADSLTALAIDAAIKSTVLLILAAIIAALLRRASAAVRHRLWCLTFAGLLLLPLLSYALPAWQIPVLPPVEAPAVAAIGVSESPAPRITGPLAESPVVDDFTDRELAHRESVPWSNDLSMHMPEMGGASLPPFEPALAELEETSTSEITPALVAPAEPSRSFFWSLPVLSLWALGGLLVLAPLVAGLLHSAWLGLRANRVTDAAWTGLLNELRGLLQLGRRVTLLELPRPVIPMTWGVLRPVVIVPQAAQHWPERLRRFVLLHELAHVKRWDVPFQLLGRAACAMYWFHPLAWYALRRLRIERELACDDCVVTTGERPSDYAEQLLQIVRTCRPAGFASVGVAMARTSHLEGRIRALFDRARSHVPLSARAARVLSLAAALLVTTVAVVRPAAREAEPVEAVESATATAETAPIESHPTELAAATEAKREPETDDGAIVRGRVLDPDGQPVAGAKLQLIANLFSRASEEDAAPVDLTATDDSGEFEFHYEPDEFYGSAGELLLVTAEGLAPHWQPAETFSSDEDLNIRLAVDDVPIRGQILDLEGNPVPGADVRVDFIRVIEDGDLDPFLEAVKEDGGSDFQFSMQLYQPPQFAPVKTDDQGRFEITGIGRDRVADLALSGLGIHHARIRVMTRESEPVSPTDEQQAAHYQTLGQLPVYGATFSYLVQPSRPIRGIVVDAETKEPLGGIRVSTLEANASADTDEEGRFELDGCVKADEYRLLAYPRDDQPYLQASIRIPDELGVEPLDITIEMTRGVVVTGRVTDANGKPVSASISYWPTFPNANLRPGIGGGEANVVGAYSDSPTDRNGEFAAIVLPGPGFIGIRASDRDAYESANVDANAFFKEHGVPYFSTVDASNVTYPFLITSISDTVSSVMPQSNFHAIELLNVDPGTEEHERKVTLRLANDDGQAAKERGIPAIVASKKLEPAQESTAASSGPTIVRGTVVDPDGNPVGGATVRVMHVKRSWSHAVPASATVINTVTTTAAGQFEFPLDPSRAGNQINGPLAEWTDVVVTAPGYGFGYGSIAKVGHGSGPASLADLSANEPLRIQLAAPQTIRGRVVDLEGRPVEGASLRAFGVAVGTSSDKVDEWLDKVGKLPAFADRDMYGRLPASVEQAGFPRTQMAEATAELFPTLQTDADGRFELDGIGRDRVALLLLNGPGLAQSVVQVLTRPLDHAVRATPITSIGDSIVFHGAELTFVAAPSAPVKGVVRDAETHEPIAGVRIVSSFLAGKRSPHEGYIATTTDAEGRYELKGLPVGKGNSIEVIPVDQPYLASLDPIEVPEARDLEPIVHDVELRKAVWVTGRLYDETTGEPVQGTLHFTPFRGNEYAAKFSQYADQNSTRILGNDRYYVTDGDGRFRIPVTPGRGVLCARANSPMYSTGHGTEEIAELRPENANEGLFPTLGQFSLGYMNTLREINPPADADEITVDLRVLPGLSQDLVFVDPAGQPVTSVTVYGVNYEPRGTSAATASRITAVGLKGGEARTIFVRQNDRNLGNQVDFTPAQDAGQQTIVLYPPVRVRGRLIDPQGAPLTEASIETRCRGNGFYIHNIEDGRTDETGVFSVGLYAGATYQLLAHGDKYTVLSQELLTRLGESIDLGDLVIDPKGKDFSAAVAKRAPIVTKSAAAAAGPAESEDEEAAAPRSGTSATATDGVRATRSPAMKRPQSGVQAAVEVRAEAPQAGAATESERSYSGRVTDTDGKPVAGATIWLALYAGEAEHEQLLQSVATSDKDGRFRFTLDPKARRLIDAVKSDWIAKLLAAAPDHGFDWLPLAVFEDNPAKHAKRDELKAHLTSTIGAERLESRSLRLRPALRPVRGQLVDLEGRPRPNVTVRVESVMQPDVRLLLQAFEEKSKDRYYQAVNAASVGGNIDRWHTYRLFPPVTTDADGRFELAGIGDDQLANLSINAPGVEAQVIHILGRSIESARLPHFDRYPGGAKDVFYGWDFTHAVGPSIPVVGVVKEFDTGEPIANTAVRVERLFSEGGGADEGQLRVDTGHLRTMTDAQGRFRIDGMPPGIGHVLEAKPPITEPYLMASQSVSLSSADAPVKEIEIQVKKVFWIEGRVTDKQSGASLPAYVDYLALEKNPHTLDKMGLRQAWEIHRYRTDSDGRYRVPGLPGPGVVMVLAIEDRGYPREVGADTVDGYDNDSRYFPTNPVGYPLSNWNLIRQIDPAMDATSFTCDFELDAGQQATGRVVGPDGAAVSNFSALGEVINVPFWKRHADGQFSVQGYDEQGPRQLFIKSPDESLIGQARLEGSPPQELVVTLEPAVRVTGRLIEQETSLPAERYSLHCDSSSLGSFRISDNCNTGDDGRFEIKGLLAGVVYEMDAGNPQHFVNGKNGFQIDLSQAKPGDVVEIGDVPKKKEKTAAAKPAAMMKSKAGETALAAASPASDAAAGKADAPHAITIRGKVVDPDGQPAAGASVFVGLSKSGYEDGFQVRPPIRATVRPDGSFAVTFSLDNLVHDTSRFTPIVQEMLLSSACIAAAAEGFGPAWIRVNKQANHDLLTLQLVPDLPIVGRFVSLEGAPLSDLELRVQFLEAAPDENLQPWIDALKSGRPLWQASADHNHEMFSLNVIDRADTIVTDSDGRFQITGIGRDRIVRVMLAGPQAARQIFRMVSRDTEPLPTNLMPAARDGDKVFGANSSAIVVAPSQPIVGTVRDAESGAPLAGVTIESYQFGGTNVLGSRDNLLRATSDQEGRFRLDGMPKVKGNMLLAVPNDEQPYFMREIAVPEQPGLDPIDLTVELHRGLWIEGKVIDLVTGGPVTASLHYLPFLENEYAGRLPEFTSRGNGYIDGLTGYQHRYPTRPDGTFRLVGLPGRGIVGAVTHTGASGTSYRAGAGSKQIAGIDERGQFPTYVGPLSASTNWPNVMVEINPPADAQSVSVVLKADPGQSVRIRVSDTAGAPVTGYRVSGQFHGSLWGEALDAFEFEVQGLGADESRTVVILDEDRRLGKVIRINAANIGDLPHGVQLEACCKVRGRLLDATGAPLSRVELTAWTEPNEDFNPMLQERARTDDGGGFEFSNVPTGSEFRLAGRTRDGKQSIEGIRIDPHAGTEIDLGNLSIGDDGRLIDKPVAAVTPVGKRANQAMRRLEPAVLAAASAAPEQAANNADAPRAITVRGKVVDPDGQPVAGATVRAQTPLWAMLTPLVPDGWEPPITETKSATDGAFEISFSTQPMGDLSHLNPQWAEIWKKTVVAVSAPGFGPAWVTYDEIEQPDQPVTLKLVEDLPVEGRIVSLEGAPLAGETIKIYGPFAAEDEDLSAWLAAISAGEPPWTAWKKTPKSIAAKLVGIPETVVSDADGRFEIRGVGRERHFGLMFESEMVAHKSVKVATRLMEPLQAVLSTPPFEAVEPVFGARFVFAATPSRTVTGTVRDAETGAPMAGAAVESYSLADRPRHANVRVLKSVTDEGGRFRLVGMPKGDGNRILVLPNDDQPYFMREFEIPNPSGLDPVDVTVDVHRGIWITGRVTDAATGKPVHARMHYLPYRNNTYADPLPEFDDNGNVNGDQLRYQTRADGTYRLVGLPGPAVIGAESVLKDYPMGQGYAELPGPKRDGRDDILTFKNPINPTPKWPTAMTYIDPPADAETVTVDFQFQSGSSVAIRLVDPDGQPLSGVEVTGRLPRFGGTETIDGAEFDAINFGPDEERTILFEHTDRAVGWVQRIKASDPESEPVVIKLQPVATVTGRLLTTLGDPITGMAVEAVPLPSGDFAKRLPSVTTGQDGRFSHSLLPGAKYAIWGQHSIRLAALSRELAIEPGQTIDLGDLRIDENGEVMAKPNAGETALAVAPATTDAANDADAPHAITVRGKVVDPDGQPAAGASVALTAVDLAKNERNRGDELLGETTADSQGRFEFRVAGVSSKTYQYPKAFARTADSAVAWSVFDLDEGTSDIVLQLQPQHLIEGQLVDLDGQPAEGVVVDVTGVVIPPIGEDAARGLRMQTVVADSPAGLKPFTTDAQGRFTIRNVAADCGVYLEIDGTDRFAPQDMSLNTGAAETRGEFDGTYRPYTKNLKAGERAVIPLAPAQLFEGVVLLGDTDQPAADAKISIWASQQENGSMTSVDSQTDAAGRFKLNPNPGIVFGIQAYPPAGDPYLIQQLRNLRWTSGEATQSMQIRLPQGVLVRGTVTDAVTGAPLSNAAVQYYADELSNPNYNDDLVIRWQGAQRTNASGEFQISVPAGPGTLLVHADSPNYVLEERGSLELSRGQAGGERNYAHAFAKIDPAAGELSAPLEIKLTPGATVSGHLVDSDGKPIETAKMISRLKIVWHSPQWRGFSDDVTKGRFEISGLRDGVEYPVYFVDVEHGLGASAAISTADLNPTIVLKPCGSAKAKLVDQDGEPIDGRRIGVYMVVTSGPSSFSQLAYRMGELIADEDFYSNMTRVFNWNAEPSDNGETSFDLLIPRATYRIPRMNGGLLSGPVDFSVESGETRDLGTIELEMSK